uniref:Putative 26 kDa salivary gland protein a n=1 Tax=Ixodes ricinus TaxID=34613 RepID=A0A090XDW4_IXORI
MRTLMGAILFSLLILCLSAKSGPVKRPKRNTRKSPGNTQITIAYLLDRNDFNKKYDLPEVEEWLKKVHGKAHEALKNAVDVSIQLQITDINESSEELSRRLKSLGGTKVHVYGGWSTGRSSKKNLRTGLRTRILLVVLTKNTIYNDFESGMLAYSVHQSLVVVQTIGRPNRLIKQ